MNQRLMFLILIFVNTLVSISYLILGLVFHHIFHKKKQPDVSVEPTSLIPDEPVTEEKGDEERIACLSGYRTAVFLYRSFAVSDCVS